MDLTILDQLTAIISAELKLRLIPGDRWAEDRLNRRLMYPRQQILTMDTGAATGEVWRCVAHALNSFGLLDAYDVAVDAVLAAEDQLGVRSVHPHWVLGIMLQAERERAEAIVRRHARNLRNTFLPPRWTGIRLAEAAEERPILEDANPQDPPRYWQRIGIAIGAIAAGVIDRDDLPADLPWDAPTVATIAEIPALPTYDAVLETIERLVPIFARDQLLALAPEPEPSAAEKPPESDERDDADDSNQPPSSSGNTDGGQADKADSEDNATGERSDDDPSAGGVADDDLQDGPDDNDVTEDDHAWAASNDDANPDDSDADRQAQAESENDAAPVRLDVASAATDEDGNRDDAEAHEPSIIVLRIPEEVLEKLRDAVAAAGEERVEIDFLQNDPNADPDIIVELPEDIPATEMTRIGDVGPAWGAVSRAASAMREPLRRTMLEFLTENEPGQWQGNQPVGRFQAHKVMRAIPSSLPHRRRLGVDERSYALALIDDRSGSMSAHIDRRSDENVYGSAQAFRWHLTAEMTVALAEVIELLAEARLTIVSYSDRVDLLKRHADPLTPQVRQQVMDVTLPDSGNNDAGAIRIAVGDLATAPCDRRFILHLTDGQFCSSAEQMTAALAYARRHSVEIAFLCLDCEPDFAQRYVPAHMAQRVDASTLPKVLQHYFRRWLRAAA